MGALFPPHAQAHRHFRAHALAPAARCGGAGQRPCNGVRRAAARAADLALARSVIVHALVSL